MKLIVRGYGINMTQQQRQIARTQALDATLARGTAKRPQSPRDLFAQQGPRGVLINWRPPKVTTEVAGYRIYKDDETSLFAEIRDPNTSQHFIDATAGSTPPVTNFFVSTISKLGNESPKVQVQSTAITEASAPTMPGTPSTFTNHFNPPPPCFSGNTKIKTRRGIVSFDSVLETDEVKSRKGWKKIKQILVHDHFGGMLFMGNAEMVTPGHRFWVPRFQDWKRADELFGQMIEFKGRVYNLELVTDSDADEEHCYQLASGRFAHNYRKI